MNNYTLPIRSPQADLETVGGKGMSLGKLIEAGFPVPDGFQITTAAYRDFVAHNDLQAAIERALQQVDPAQPETFEQVSAEISAFFMAARIPLGLTGAILKAYAGLPGADPAVAVRSSATAEDLPQASFAGQQETYLNIHGGEAVVEAVRKCWASLWTGRAISYRLRQQIPPDRVALAVVVQLLVPAEAAGIMFTANPLNGNRDQTVINAAWGFGEAVVGGGVTPDTVVVDKSTGEVLERKTAQKRVMTVKNELGTNEQAVPEDMQLVPVLNDMQAASLAQLGTQIEALYGMPMDIEWTLCEGAFAIVQARPITALPEAPIVWTPPNPKGTYMRASVADLMPEPLSPLFISLGLGAQRAQMGPLGERVTGKKPVLHDDYLGTINNYAYLNAAFPAKSWWWILTGLIPSYPKLLRQMVPFWRDELHPEYKAFVSRRPGGEPSEMSPEQIWSEVQDLVDASSYYVCGLMFATMGASAGSEALLTRVYNRLVRQEGDPDVTSLLMGWDNIAVQSEKSLFDLAMWAREDKRLSEYLLHTSSAELAERLQSPETVDIPLFPDFAARFEAHLEGYGHIVFQLDFAESLPRDHPEMHLETVRLFLRGAGTNPYERQQASERHRIQTTKTLRKRLKGLRGWIFRLALNWGQSMAEVREDALAEIGLAYPRIRVLLHEFGRRLVAESAIQTEQDIFWLEKAEIDTCVERMKRLEPLETRFQRVAARKQLDQRLRQVSPPPMMPIKERIMGIKSEIYIPHAQQDQAGDVLLGVATSAGRVRAAVRVLRGPQDFDQMQPGEVLVAGTTTPAWTPLFAMASAVVTDIGGPLSHGSIVAREYGIPAVMGTGVATKVLQNGQVVTVDGTQGRVEFGPENGLQADASEVEWEAPDPKGVFARGSLAEHLPGPVSPLFATLGVEIANRATLRLWEGFLGVKNAEQMIGTDFYMVINQYMYGGFRMGIRNLIGIFKLMFSQIGPMFRGTTQRWRLAREELEQVVLDWEGKDVATMKPGRLFEGVRQVFEAACEYYTVIQTTLPAASSSEVLFGRFYNLMIRRRQDPEFTTLLFGLETVPVRAEKSIFDISTWLAGEPGLEAYVRKTPTDQLIIDRGCSEPPQGLKEREWNAWLARLDDHFSRFGRTAYEFDFANPTPAEAPEPVFEALKLFLSGHAESPYDRLQAAVDARERAVQAIEARIGWPRLGWFRRLLHWAQDTGSVREDSIFDMGKGHPVIRRMLGELGRRLVTAGALDQANDIYWLEQGELEFLIRHLESQHPLPDFTERIPARKKEWENALHFRPPVLLPEKSGWSRLIGGGEASQEQGKTLLKGIGTSEGTITAPACVLFSPADFSKMKAGDVLVAVTTNPAWTPMFSLASAVVTDIGGPLSHSSIVAREYGIPAVMAARNATRHIKSGQLITVDGKQGTVVIENHHQ